MKKEIVTIGDESIDPNAEVGEYLSPNEWNKLLEDDETILIDTRNNYEYSIGTFKKSINPNTSKFREFPKWLEKQKFSNSDKRKVPATSTAALPDIVFMLLFFFMVTTVFKEKESKKVQIDKVTVAVTEDLQKNVLAAYYWIGRVPGKFDSEGNEAYSIQLDDDIVSDADIEKYLKALKEESKFKTKWYSDFYNVFKIDDNAKMRLIKKVQDQLKKAEAFKVLYSVDKK